jgi:hypothetical protein
MPTAALNFADAAARGGVGASADSSPGLTAARADCAMLRARCRRWAGAAAPFAVATRARVAVGFAQEAFWGGSELRVAAAETAFERGESAGS